ncbi:hydrolase [Pseudorhodoferax aquiterrae]|uniref:Hydrolase n=1 Tax=Pseudorhodoferax aquiterrae TaxID=747304 RepID=A0ABQ3G6Q2_9BURK|nr:isochorismatase family protein [Pseudorhodoferax aquiterrae]GHC93489.1 hydrolase [Pseudorhodoferax aquiterrae]
MKTCLILIDAQESFRHRPFYDPATLAAWLAAQNALIAACQQRGVPIVRVLHVASPQTADNPFALASGHVRPIAGLAEFTPAASFHKSRHSALVSTGLEVWLTQQGIGRLLISGIRTEQCCETTARHASDLGWAVDFCAEATLTWDMRNADGSVLSAADIRTRTATVLQDRFAQVVGVDQAIARLEGAAC